MPLSPTGASPLSSVVQAMRPGQLLCGGKLSQDLQALAREQGVPVCDYFAREELAAERCTHS